MKNLGFFNKLVFLLNSLFAFLLLVGYLLPFIPPKVFPTLSVLTLVLPLLIIANLVFALYWVFQLKRQMWLSSIILVLGFFLNVTLFKFSDSKENQTKDGLRILSYNVHMFTKEEKKKAYNVSDSIWSFVKGEDPDIVCFQEFSSANFKPHSDYRYSYQKLRGGSNNFGQAIFSKHEIINKGSLEFPNTGNNIIFADIVRKKDTIRIYNIHMQSLALSPRISGLQQENKKRLLSRLGEAFKKQQDQTEIFLKHEAKCPYTKVLAGDFNNTIFSHAYNKIRGDKKDAFAEAGSWFGRTFIFDFIPLRIDFILVDQEIEVLNFKNFKTNYSDHYPIEAQLQFKN